MKTLLEIIKVVGFIIACILGSMAALAIFAIIFHLFDLAIRL